MSKPITESPTRKSSPMEQLFEGVAAVLLAIKKSHPELETLVTEFSRQCGEVLTQRHYARGRDELKSLAQSLHQHWQHEQRGQKRQFTRIAEALSSLPTDAYTETQRENLQNLVQALTEGDGRLGPIPHLLAKTYVDMAETVNAYRQKAYGEQQIHAGPYEEGVANVHQADLAAVTVRITKNLVKLTRQLAQLHPDDDHVIHLKDRIQDMSSGGVHFFEGVDTLTDATWLLYRLSDGAIARERAYLANLTQELASLSEDYLKSQTLVNTSSAGLDEFQDNVTDELRRLSEAGNNGQTLGELRRVLKQSVSSLKARVTQHVDHQNQIILKQKATVEAQAGMIKSLSEKTEVIRQKYEQASEENYRDPLTRIGNRRSFDREVATMHERWANGDIAHLAIMLIDLDYFKTVNDTHGHVVGDEVLLHVSRLLQTPIKTDSHAHLSRYGGEEFAIVTSHSQPKEALALAKKLKETITTFPYESRSGDIIELSASIGVSFFTPKHNTILTVLEGADRALYKAKEIGRNALWIANLPE